MSYQEIEAAVAELTEIERLRLLAFMRRLSEPDDAWDRQMASDAAAGKFDALVREAEEDAQAGRLRNLPLA